MLRFKRKVERGTLDEWALPRGTGDVLVFSVTGVGNLVLYSNCFNLVGDYIEN